MAIKRRDLFYQFAFGGGVSSDISTVRARVFRFIKEIIGKIDPQTGTPTPNELATK